MSLPFMMLTKDQARHVIGVVERDLLTPSGLRTLVPGDPRYQGRYEGDAAMRDARYHQGTVWPWLMGSFVPRTLSLSVIVFVTVQAVQADDVGVPYGA